MQQLNKPLKDILITSLEHSYYTSLSPDVDLSNTNVDYWLKILKKAHWTSKVHTLTSEETRFFSSLDQYEGEWSVTRQKPFLSAYCMICCDRSEISVDTFHKHKYTDMKRSRRSFPYQIDFSRLKEEMQNLYSSPEGIKAKDNIVYHVTTSSESKTKDNSCVQTVKSFKDKYCYKSCLSLSVVIDNKRELVFCAAPISPEILCDTVEISKLYVSPGIVMTDNSEMICENILDAYDDEDLLYNGFQEDIQEEIEGSIVCLQEGYYDLSPLTVIVMQNVQVPFPVSFVAFGNLMVCPSLNASIMSWLLSKLSEGQKAIINSHYKSCIQNS